MDSLRRGIAASKRAFTEEGKSLKPVLKSVKKWGEEHAMDLIEERQQTSD